MDNKELPQEVVNEIASQTSKDVHLGVISGDGCYDNAATLRTKGAQITHSHYLKELQAKDTTIKEQAEKIEKLTGLLGSMYSLWFNMTHPIHTLNEGIKAWNKYKEQHGI